MLLSPSSDGNIYFCDSTVEQCYLNLPEDMVEENPLDLENMKERQDEDDNLIQSTVRHPTWYSHKTINDIKDILCYTKPGDNAASWRIALREDLILPTIKWYHQVTGHPGSKRLYEQLRQRYYHRDLRRLADNLNCDFCQRNKLDGQGYVFLPEREVCSISFEECDVDLIGPWRVQVHKRPHQFEAFDVLIQDPKSRTQGNVPSQDPKSRTKSRTKSRFQAKIPNQKHKLYLLFV